MLRYASIEDEYLFHLQSGEARKKDVKYDKTNPFTQASMDYSPFCCATTLRQAQDDLVYEVALRLRSG